MLKLKLGPGDRNDSLHQEFIENFMQEFGQLYFTPDRNSSIAENPHLRIRYVNTYTDTGHNEAITHYTLLSTEAELWALANMTPEFETVHEESPC